MDNQDSTPRPSFDPSAPHGQIRHSQDLPGSAWHEPSSAHLARSKEQNVEQHPILFTEMETVLLLQQEPPRPMRLRRTRRWLRSRAGRIVVPLFTLLLGLVLGLSAVIWYGLSGEGPITVIPTSTKGSLMVEADKDFVTQLVRSSITKSGLPGQVENVTVQLARGAEIVVAGDDIYSVLGLSLSRHFTVDVQPYVRSCLLQARVTHADLGGIPVTAFVQLFQSQINQQIGKKPAGLPAGFTYCTAAVRTEPGGLFITYQATPEKQ